MFFTYGFFSFANEIASLAQCKYTVKRGYAGVGYSNMVYNVFTDRIRETEKTDFMSERPHG